MADSTLSSSQKRTILTQEGLELGAEIQKKHLHKFMVKLKNSGYNIKFRTEILNSILNAFEKMEEDDKTGVKPMFRSRDWNREERDLLKSKNKCNWWNEKAKVQYKSVLFVTPTPEEVLAKYIKKREEELNKNNSERIKVVEKGGKRHNFFKKSIQEVRMHPKNVPNVH